MAIVKHLTIVLLWLGLGINTVVAQLVDDDPILVGDSGVGYIDSAVLGNQIRVRFESAYDIDRANRAEFIWAWPPPQGDGPPQTEISTDYQSLALYLEGRWSENVAGFVELAGVLSNPVINDNSGGLGDMNLGLKLALFESNEQITTLQTRLYVPTGNAERALGTDHASLEPAFLHLRKLNSLWTSESELRFFTPLGGTENRRGSMFRYGTGLSCLLWESSNIRVLPVTEFVGWSVLNGSSSFVDSVGDTIVEQADGDTIINGKFGCRFVVGENNFYAGYGHALTGDVWYRDVLRIEWRKQF
jgi:hypothetical protein